MITVELARAVLASGVVWDPQPGDRFVVPVDDLTEQVFVLSDVIADLHHFPAGDVIGFNGTTEWALDSIEVDRVVWLPREDQLRELLDDRLVALERRDGDAQQRYAVHVRGSDGATQTHTGPEPETAYARAVIAARATR